jgi:hypothetical protein
MKRNLFDYSYFIEEMKIHPNKPRDKETVLKYEELFGSQKGLTLQDQPFYKEYLSLFRIPFKVSVPENISDDFDWDLLFRLIFGSISSSYSLDLKREWKKNPQLDPLVQLSITVKSEDKDITRVFDKLWSFQILRLFEIYVLEQLDLAILEKEEEEKDKIEAVEREKVEKLRIYRKKKLLVHREVRAYQALMQLIPT